MLNKKNLKQPLSLLLLLQSLTLSSIAQADHSNKLDHLISLSLEDLVTLETTIATASKQTSTKAPAVVTLITQDDIKATGATNLVEVLEGVPGIHIRANQFGNRPLVQFRGAKGTQTLLMINGNSMTDLVWNFGIFWKGLPANIIERVEIIRGPGSALFGADASAGVVNVITKTAGIIERSEAGVRMGSFNTKEAWVQHGNNWNDVQIGFTANISETDGYNPFIEKDAQSRIDPSLSYAPDKAQYGWRNEDIRFSLAKDNWRVQGDYASNSKLQIGLTGFGFLDPATQGKDSRYNLDFLYANDQFADNWEVDAELRYQQLDYTSGSGFIERPPGYTDINGDVYPDGQINKQSAAERRTVFEASTLYTGINNHSIRIGAGYTIQDLHFVEHIVNFGKDANGNTIVPGSAPVDISGSPYAFAPEDTRKIAHLYLQDIWTISDVLEFTAGARYDNYSDFGNTFNPRLALVWQSTDKLTTKVLYGRAFRPPSYLELYDETSFTSPNPNLAPERSETLDLVFAYAANADLQVEMNLFYFKQFDIITAASGTFNNTGDHVITGIEFETRWQATDNVNVYGNFTARTQDDNNFKAYQEPNQDAYIRADWGFSPMWNWNIQANWIGKRERKSTDTRAPLPSDTVTDTTLRYAATNDWEFALSIRNVFNSDAREYTGGNIPNDLPLPERNAYLEARYKF